MKTSNSGKQLQNNKKNKNKTKQNKKTQQQQQQQQHLGLVKPPDAAYLFPGNCRIKWVQVSLVLLVQL